MASLEDLLGKTMLFTAAKDAGLDAMSALRRPPGDALSFPPPPAVKDANPATQAVWHWTHDPAKPAAVKELKAFTRSAGENGMFMPVCTEVEVESVTIKIAPKDDAVELPLKPAYVLAKFLLPSAAMKASTKGWWHLEANVDHSMLVVFGYELPPASGAAPKPLKIEQIQSLGKRFYPDPDVPSDDPDAPDEPSSGGLCAPPAIATVNQCVPVFLAPTWVIIAFGFTTCKERADFEPGGILGAGRFYPHVMVTSNQRATEVECKMHIARPPMTMSHPMKGPNGEPDPYSSMEPDIRPIFVTDCNEAHDLLAPIRQLLSAHGLAGLSGWPTLPFWCNLFSYYDLNPTIGQEACLVDPGRPKRTIAGAIRRERGGHFGGLYEDVSSFGKMARQGDFDNLHLAPRMKFTNSTTGAVVPSIAMAPFCEHDCLHTHTRWGTPGPTVPASNWGFLGRVPYAESGAPLVPNNQAVFITLTSSSSFRYRAVAKGPIVPATCTVFNHHGSAYALAIQNPALMSGLALFLTEYVGTFTEPMVRVEGGVLTPVHVSIDANPERSIAAFYQRLQFTGKANPDKWLPRLDILNLSDCRK